MTGALRAELRKLRRPAVAVLVAAGLLVTGLAAGYSLEFASGQAKIARNQLTFAESQRPDRSTCAEALDLSPGPECRALLAEDLQATREFARKQAVTATAADGLGRLPGAVSFAAGTVGGAVGLIVLLAVAALHVAGEWQRDRGALLMSTGAARWQVLLAKVMSTWLVGALLVLLGALVVLLVSVASAGLWPLPDMQSSSTDGPSPFARAAGALGVTATWAAVVVAVAVAARDARLALLSGAGVLGLLVGSVSLGGPAPGAAIGRLTKGSGTRGIYDSLWPATDALPSVALAAVVTAALAAAAFAAAVWWVNSSDHA